MDGILVVNKPCGMTSHDVVNIVRRITKEKKCGHTGTLDPMASGVLVCCLGKATRLIQFISEGEKRYTAKVMLGTQTDTGDATGNVTTSIQDFSVMEDHLRQALINFVGDVKQIPPMYSAVHHNGVRLYELARAGKSVEREAREIHVSSIELLSASSFPLTYLSKIELDIACSKGTYIRTLAEDIAKDLGTVGHLVSLERTKNSGFPIDESFTLEQLKMASEKEDILSCILPLEKGAESLKRVVVDEEEEARIRQGLFLIINESFNEKEEMVALFKQNGKIVSIGCECIDDKNGHVIKPKIVFNEV